MYVRIDHVYDLVKLKLSSVVFYKFSNQKENAVGNTRELGSNFAQHLSGRAWLVQLVRSLLSDHKVPGTIKGSAKI